MEALYVYAELTGDDDSAAAILKHLDATADENLQLMGE